MADEQPVIAPGMVPVITPQGDPGSVPFDKLDSALASGFKKAVAVTSPKGEFGLVPHDKAADAIKIGFTIGLPTTSVEKGEKPGFFSRAWDWVNKGVVPAQDVINTVASHPEMMTPHIAGGLGVGSKSGPATPEDAVPGSRTAPTTNPPINVRQFANRPPMPNETPGEAGARSLIVNTIPHAGDAESHMITAPL